MLPDVCRNRPSASSESSVDLPLDPREPEIIYPCPWEYKTIGRSEELMRAAIAVILEEGSYSLAVSHVSRTGKYCSLVLEVTVASEEHRNEIFAALRDHPDIMMVL